MSLKAEIKKELISLHNKSRKGMPTFIKLPDVMITPYLERIMQLIAKEKGNG